GESRTVSSCSVIGNLGLLVKLGADSVSYKLSNNADSVGFNHLLHRSTDITDRAADPRGLDRSFERCLRYIKQLLDLRLEVIPDRNRHCRVSVVAVQNHAAVDRDDIAFLQYALRG